MSGAKIHQLPRSLRGTKADLSWARAIAESTSDDPRQLYSMAKSAFRQIDARLERGADFESDGALKEASALAFFALAKILGISLNISPELATLIENRKTLGDRLGRANAAADELEWAIKRREAGALARKNELPKLREAEGAANTVCDENDQAIAAFPSRTIADCTAKLRLFANEICGLELFPNGIDGLSEALLLGVLADLNRLAA